MVKDSNQIEMPTIPSKSEIMVSHYLKRVCFGEVNREGIIAMDSRDITGGFNRCVIDKFFKDSPVELTDPEGRIFLVTIEQIGGPEFPKE
jgi:hypothetical protein